MNLRREIDTVESYLADGEEIVHSINTDSQIIVLTDRRILSYSVDSESDTAERTIESTYYEAIGGTQIVHQEGKDVDRQKLQEGGIVACVGVFSFLIIPAVPGSTFGELIGAIGFVLLLIGIFFAFAAYNTDSGTVEMVIQTDEARPALSAELSEESIDDVQKVERTLSEVNKVRKS